MIPGFFKAKSLKSRLAYRLISIAVIIIAVNFALVAHFDVADRNYLLIDAVRYELATLHDAMPDTEEAIPVWASTYTGIYKNYPESYAFAVIKPDEGMIAGKNTDLLDTGFIDGRSFTDNWVRWPSGKDELPVAGTQSHSASGDTLHIVFFMAGDPAKLVDSVIADEYLGHVWLPLMPITILLIGGTLFILWRGLRPLEVAANWARRIEPGKPLPELSLISQPAEVENLTGALRRTVNRLDDELNAEQRRAAEAAHALRTPVAVLVARLDSLPGDIPEVDQIKADVRALSRTVTQTLTSAGADRLEVSHSQRADLNKAASMAIADLQGLAENRNVNLMLTRAKVPVIVNGDENAIHLAITNLIENAIHHADTDTVRIDVNSSGTVSVRDYGKGLSGISVESLLKPFERGLGPAKGGAGLGLAIVDRIQRAHAGRIEAVEASGNGVEFRLHYRLP